MFNNIFDPIDDSQVDVNSIKGKMILKKYINNFLKGGSNTNLKPDLVLFHSKSCPHCVKMMPIWKEVREEIEKSELNNKVNIKEIEKDNEEMMKQHNIQSFPTIKL